MFGKNVKILKFMICLCMNIIFELEGEYCEADINNYFQSKEEKRQRELRDSKYKFWK